MSSSSQPIPRPAYQDSSLPIQERVNDLVSRMALKEKISQMVYDAPAIERLGIPKYNWWNECLHGVGRAGIATSFPQAIGLAATWNTGLMHRVAVAISDEARAKHHETARLGIREIYTGLTFWSPNINIFRDPRWGRGQETYGEDPHLTARMGVAFVKGLQGNDPKWLKLVATVKHYAVHSGKESERHRFDAQVDDRDLLETYLPAFETCVKEAAVVSVMGAYNRTNGEPCCASPTLIEKILRQEWGFEGYFVSDCWAIRDFFEGHGVVDTPEEAAALAVNTGCDLNCGNVFPALLDAVEQGLISEDAIDRAICRLFTARFRLGLFDPPERVPYTQIPFDVNDSRVHRALALRTARESIVLLKNEDGLLPLRKDITSIAVIGPNAAEANVMLGNYNGSPSRIITPLAGIRSKISPATKLYTARGCGIAAGVPTLSVIPPANLRPARAGQSLSGLTAEYFDNLAWEGDPSIERTDPVVDFTWTGGQPVTDNIGDSFSVRWTGSLVPPVTGTFTLGVRGFSQFALTLDSAPVAQYEGVHHPRLSTKRVELEAGRIYDLRLDYANRSSDPQVHLLWSIPGTDLLTPAIEAAEKADIVVLVMGLSSDLEGEEMPVKIEGFDGGDRTHIKLPRPQEELLREIHSLGKPVVLVLISGSALAVNWANDNIPAIIQAWYPGQAGGDAVADVLFGDYNPGGRLPVTFYRAVEDLPPFEDYAMEQRTYRYFRGQPLFPFGHGLSYTAFSYSDLRLSSISIPADEMLSVSVDVENTGDRPGDEVVQLYVSDLEASVPVPIRQLQGFERVHLAPGQRKTVSFTLAPRQLSLILDDGQRVVEPGLFQVTIGGRQPTAEDLAGEAKAVLIHTFEVTSKGKKSA